MRFHVLTLFPEMIEQGMNTSITGRAIASGVLSVNPVNIRDYAEPQRKSRVDDYPYGGGAGMVMQAEPVYRAWEAVVHAVAILHTRGTKPFLIDEFSEHHNHNKIRTIYLTPQGKVFNQDMAKEFAREEDLIFLCGHYEGIDERVLEEIVTDPVSIGDYVLTGGELPAMVMMDAIARMVPGVLSNEDSGKSESFEGNLLEYPQYTRPEVWHERAVPPILLSGHHANVETWRRQQSLLRTKQMRPDLFAKVTFTKQDQRFLRELSEEAADPADTEK